MSANSDKIGACRIISDSARSQDVLTGLVALCAADSNKLSGLARLVTNRRRDCSHAHKRHSKMAVVVGEVRLVDYTKERISLHFIA